MEKTTVTNGSVTESEEENQSQDITQDGEGKSQSNKEIENKVRVSLRAEYDRKQVQLSEKLESVNAELADLKEKDRLSRAEKEEKARLESRADGLEAELNELETNPKYRAYRAKIERSVEKAKKEIREELLYEVSLEQAKEFIEERATALGMSQKELGNALAALLKDGLYSNLQPFARTKRIYRDWTEKEAAAKEREEARKKKEEEDSFSENSNKSKVFTSYREAKKSGSLIDKIKAIGQYHRD